MSVSETSIRIGYLSTMYHTSLLIKGLRWLENEGMVPSWTLFGTGPAIVESLVQGKLDLGYIGLAPTIIGIAKGAAIKCVAGGHVEGTVIIAKQSYKSAEECSGDISGTLQQFKGKTLGVPRRGSLHDIFLRHYLANYDLAQEVQLVNYEWPDFIPDAMLRNEIEGAAGTPSLAILSSRVLGARVIIPPNLIWPNNPSYGIVTDIGALKKRPELLEKYLELHKKACSQIREKPETAARIISETIGLVDERFVLDAIRLSPKYCVALSSDYVASTMRLLPVLRELKYISKDLNEEDIFDFSLIERVHPEPAHY